MSICKQEKEHVVYSSVQIIWAFRAKTVHMQKSIFKFSKQFEFY